MAPQSRYRWVVVVIFFLFMLLHQTDKLLIGPLTTRIQDTFAITNTEMGAVSTGALVVGAVLYPVWGYLYDRYARAKLLAIGSLLWGLTTTFNATARNYGSFLVSRASTGIDDSSYPGLYSIIADYFGPSVRGKIYGLLQITSPVGYLVALVLAELLAVSIGWRSIYYITGGLGVLLAFVIFFAVKEPARGNAEPEMNGLAEISVHKFDWKLAGGLFRKPTMLLLFVQGFFGIFPWQVITYWFFAYLERERGYSSGEILTTMGTVILVLSASYFAGGAAGDAAFRRTPRGRLVVSAVAVLLGAVFLTAALSVPVESKTLFFVTLMLTAVFMPVAGPNIISAVQDITLPEVRSTALAVQLFMENIGAASAPLLAGIIADRYDLRTAFMVICTTAWVLCAIFYAVGAYLIPNDVEALRAEMRERSSEDQAAQAGAGAGHQTLTP